MKDLNTIGLLPDLIRAGVSSLKIEGRMKSPAYAAGVIPGRAGDPIRLQCRRGDWLEVSFKATGEHFTDVFLTGPAEWIENKTH